MVLSLLKKVVGHSRICIAFFLVICQNYSLSVHTSLFLTMLDSYECLFCILFVNASGGNKIDDLTSVDSLNSFPMLKVWF